MQPLMPEEKQSQENVLKPFLLKYISYWPLFIILFIVAGLSAWLYLQYKVPVYEMKATIIIKDEDKGLDDSKILESLNLFGSKKIVENEIEVIKSKTLAKEVVKNLDLYAPVYEEDKFTDRSAYISSPVKIVAKDPDGLEAGKKIYFTFDKNKQEVTLYGKTYQLNQWINTAYGVIQFRSNPNYQAPNESKVFYFSLVPVAYVADDLVNGLSVISISKSSTVINIIWNDDIIPRGKAIVNELINAYNRAAIADKNVLAANTLSFVEDRLQYVVHELDSVEGKLQHFKTQNKIVDIDEQGKMFLQNVGQNDQKISDISMQVAILDQVESYVSGKEKKGGIVPSTLGITDPVLSTLLDKLYNAELDYEKVRKVAPENNPVLVALTDQINKIKPSILENIQSQRKALMAGKGDLMQTNGKYSSMLSNIPVKERELLEISRQQAIKNNIYTFLLQKREEAAISYASAVADSRIVDMAQPSKLPVSPNKPMAYILAMIAAFGVGASFISIKDLFNSTISSRADIESFTTLPIIAEVVKKTSKNAIVVNQQDQSFISEQFRHLRTMLGYLGINNRKKKIMVTSTIAGEGKSFVAANIAMSLALTNKKTVIVDLDLRKPTIAGLFKLPLAEGVSEFLKGEKEIEEIIKKSDLDENLFIIPCGTIPLNPSELLLNGKIVELFAYLDNAFDVVIIDTTPTNPVTDAGILSPLCDATLYVIRQGVAPNILIQKLDKYLQMKGMHNVGIVFNDVKAKGADKYMYGYRYAYGYKANGKKSIWKKRAY